MNAKELRIGNLVYFDGIIDTVTERCFERIKSRQYGKYYQPIPLTEDWLVRLGFEFTNGHFIKGKANLRLFTNGECQFIFRFRYMVSIYYVHQLQNLYFALTGEELTEKI